LSEILTETYETIKSRYDSLKSRSMRLDISRGKPGPDQLALVSPLLNDLPQDAYMTASGIDCRNYGGVEGISEMRGIFADLLGTSPDSIIAGGNSSLSLMYDRISNFWSHGVCGGKPWALQGPVKFVCPSPGYDRHFSICEYFGIQMVSIEMSESGPDMDAAEALIQSDPTVKGMWCVPVYSNPTGCVYSNETISRIARLKPKAPDFRLFWDNAYTVHNFAEERPVIPDILSECAKNGSANMPLEFASFSKVSFPGAAVAAVAASANNKAQIVKCVSAQSVGPDKLNQLRHVHYFKDADGVCAHMRKMAAVIKPKFDTALSALENELSGLCEWSRPKGGYFIHFRSADNHARRIVELCAQAGLAITEAGAVHPYKRDPKDRDLRIAPTYASTGELKSAMEIFCAAVKLSYVEKMESINNSTEY